MHNSTKDVLVTGTKEQRKDLLAKLGLTEDQVDDHDLDDGMHIISITNEADGPFEMASPKARLDAKVIALRRTDSGGIFLQIALSISEPKPEVPKAPEPVKPEPTQEEQAADYLVSTGLKPKEAEAAVERFGAAKILKKKQEALDAELEALLTPGKPSEPPAPAA